MLRASNKRWHMHILSVALNCLQRMSKRRLGFPRILASTLVFLMLSSPVLASKVGPYGAPTGKPFSIECAAGEYLVGLEGRAGAWLDAVAPICALWDVKGQKFVKPRVGRMVGSQGGGPQRRLCWAGLVVGSATVELKRHEDRLVSQIRVGCFTVVPPHVLQVMPDLGVLPGTGPLIGGTKNYGTEFHCPANEMATGIFGRSGRWVDAFGLICGPAPAAKPEFEAAESTKAKQKHAPKMELPKGRLIPDAKDSIARKGTHVIPGNVQPTEPLPPTPVSKDFPKPLTVGYERLNACLELPKSRCGSHPAQLFCESKGFARYEEFHIERGNIRSETWFGKICKKKCQVFTAITCMK